MKIVELTKDIYKDWDKFCLTCDEAWFWHTSSWLKYILSYKIELKPLSKSFFVLNNNKIIAICPLVMETKDGIKEFSSGGDYGIIPALSSKLTSKTRAKIVKLIFTNIDRIAQKHGVKRTRLRFSILDKSFIESSPPPYNFLMKYGYLDTTINSNIIDLSLSLAEIKRNIRHGHRYDLARAKNILSVAMFEKMNITKSAYEEYANLHHKAAGRVTRPQATFDMMYDFIKLGYAFLVGAKKNNKIIGFAYFFQYKNAVYYGSACNDPDQASLPIAHFIQWEAIKIMKGRNIKFYEIGRQYFSHTLSSFPTQKEKNISNFLRGFGGKTVPLFRGEKYYCQEYFIDVYNERINKCAPVFSQYAGGKDNL